jgi:hypothetical protein
VRLSLRVRAFAPAGPLILGIDDAVERRWGQRIAARGVYRDPTRSSRSHFAARGRVVCQAHVQRRARRRLRLLVRAHWWRPQRFRISTREAEVVKLPRRVLQRLSEAACYAA